jgi:parafibromin
MASIEADQSDPLLHFRAAATHNIEPLLGQDDEPTDASEDVFTARYLHFAQPAGHKSFPLSTNTRFIVDETPIDLRTIYVAWLNRDASLTEYRDAVQQLNDSLSKAGVNAQIQALPVPVKFDLISWLKAEQDDSDYIQPLDVKDTAAKADGSAAVAAGTAGGIATVSTAPVVRARGPKTVDARLIEIYRGERKVGHGDRNGVLRGIKPTVRPISSSLVTRKLTMSLGFLPRSQNYRALHRTAQ